MTNANNNQPYAYNELARKRYLVDKRHVATYYAKERRDLLAEALASWRLMNDGGNNV